MLFRFESFAWDISLGTFVRDRSLKKRLAGCASQLVLPSGFCRLESFDEDLSLDIFRDLSLGNARPVCADRLGLSLGIFRSGTSV